MHDTLVSLRLLSPCLWKIGVYMLALGIFAFWAVGCTWPMWWPDNKK